MHGLQTLVRKQLAAAWRYRWPAILFSWLVCAGGWAAVFMIPNQYESSARMYVDADAILTPLLRGITVDTALTSQVDLLQRTLLSRPNLERLVSRTDLELELQGTSDRQAMVERLSNEIRIFPQTRNLFTITYRNKSPKLAYDVVQNMLATFVESKAGNNRNDLDNASRFLQEQLNSYERQLRDAERRRAEFRAKYVDLLPAEGGGSRIDGASGLVKQLQGQLQDAEARRASLSKELAATPPMLVTESEGSAAGGGVSRLQAAERTLQELRLRLTETHPDVIAQRQLVNAIRTGAIGPAESSGPRAVAPRSRSVPNPVYEQMKVRLVENDSSIASLQRQIADASQERDRLNEIARSAPGLQAESINLNRDYEVLRKNYDELVTRRESMRISSAAETSADKVKVQIIDPPQIPLTPVAPKRLLLITGVFAAGLGAGAALALLLVQLDQSFHSTDDLRDLGFPVVGGVSLLAVSVPFARRLFSVGSFALAVAVPGLIYGGLVLRLLRGSGAA